MRRLLVLLISLLFLAGCGAKQGPHLAQEQLQKLVKRATKEYKAGQWEIAEEAFREIRDRFPDSPYALWAELKMADCKFYAKEYQEAIVLYQEFEKLHPTNEAIPYVLYQIGTCYYKMILPPDRDQSFTRKAIEAYQRLLASYPDSPYTWEVKKRIAHCREVLADHELYVAHFYHRIHYYRAAYHRLLYLLQTYPHTKAAQKAQRQVRKYYAQALEETKKLAAGTLKDFWGQPVR